MWRNTRVQWGLAARLLHWLGALMIAVLLAHGWWMTRFAARPRVSQYAAHADLGYVFLFLVLARLVWRMLNPTPALPAGSARWERVLAPLTHWLLYILMAAVSMVGWGLAGTFRTPLTGAVFGLVHVPQIVFDTGLHETLEDAHKSLAYLLAAVAALHVAAALRHHFVKRNDVLRRMIGGARPMV
ncbi:MAG TPA: cytochrome b/b6 domain-containing protein [Caulobacteraceae bacterium]|jgi:cytochrome b561|nr:cytochrome b/b6 domain-containing protein [Caulobacteraceae bacterium]